MDVQKLNKKIITWYLTYMFMAGPIIYGTITTLCKILLEHKTKT